MADTLPFDPLAPKPLPKPGPRKPLSKFDFATKFLEQGGLCYICSKRLVRGKVIDEHEPPRETLPADVCDDLKYRKLACKPCAKAKTVGDQALIAHGRHIRGETGQRARRERRGEGSIKGRGFSKNLTKGFDGKVRVRG